MRFFKIAFFLPFIFVQTMVYGQQLVDSTITSDSVLINQHQKGIRRIIEQQKEDSLKRGVLETQLLNIQISDRKEKEKLQSEIRFLRSRDSILFNRKKQKIDSLRQLNAGVPVAPFQDTLFVIYNQVGSYSKKERASAIESRVKLLADQPGFQTDSLKALENEEEWIIFWQDHMVVSINDLDAMWANTTKEELAQKYSKAIMQGIEKYRKETSLQRYITGILLSCLIIMVVILIIYVIRRSNRWIKLKIRSSNKKYLTGLRIKEVVLVSPQKQRKFIWFILDFFQWVLFFTSIYLALPIILNQFPGTEGYANMLFGYFINPLKNIARAVLDYLPDLATIIVITFVFKYFLRALKYVAQEIEVGNIQINGFYKEWAKPTYEIARALLMMFLLIVIFPYFPGSDSPIFKGVSVFLGVIVTFSSAGALGNIVSGLMITYMRSFAIGDRIKIGEVSGDIVEKSLLATKVRTVKNEIISIPNSQIMNSHTINYSVENEEFPLIIHTDITLAYEIAWQRVHELAINACRRTELLDMTLSPFVLQSSLEDFYVRYQINAYTKFPHKQSLIYSELHKNILEVFHQAGIELLSPSFTAVRDGSTLDMPETNRPEKGSINPIRVDLGKNNES